MTFPAAPKRTTTSTKQRRLKYLALLAVRLLALLLLILAFAQPYWERTVPAGSGKRMLVAAVDNSFSMRRGGAFEAAKREAKSTATSDPPLSDYHRKKNALELEARRLFIAGGEENLERGHQLLKEANAL